MYDANAISKEILDTRNAELLAQNAALSSARARLAEAELNLEFTQVRAPISGRVNETRLDEGNLVSADSTLLATIEKATSSRRISRPASATLCAMRSSAYSAP